jgi:hypothetical protein
MPLRSSLVLGLSLLLAQAAGPTPAMAAEPAAKKCRYQPLGRLPLRYHGHGLQLTTEGNINGTPAILLVDTGADDTMLTRLGTDKRRMRTTPMLGWVEGVGGSSRLYTVAIKNFDVGPIKSNERGELLLIDDMGNRPETDAIVASSFLLQVDLEVSLAEKQLKFFEPNNCQTTFLGYWDHNAVEVPLKFEEDMSRPLVDVQLNGVTLRALIDTGATVSAVSLDSLGKLGLSAESAGMEAADDVSGIGSKLVKSYRYRFKSFAIGHEVIQNPKLRVMYWKPDGIDVVLGTDFLRAHRVLFASSQKRVYLSYVGGAPFETDEMEAWVVREAEQGNGYAQYALASAMASQDPEQANKWLEKAVVQGNPRALRTRAAMLEREGQLAQALPLYERAMQDDPYDLHGQLDLFRLRARAGKLDEAKAALTTTFERLRYERWPREIGDYYLGKLTLDALLREARSDKDLAKRRLCEVYHHAGPWLALQNNEAGAAELAGKHESECTGSLASN